MKFSKKFLIVLLAVILLVLVGGYSYSKLKPGKTTINTPNPSGPSGVFTSIKDALLDKTASFVCEFREEDESVVKSYIKMGKVRMDVKGKGGEQSSQMLILDKKMYLWDDKTKQGFVYDSTDDQQNQDNQNTFGNQPSPDDYLKLIENYKDYCKISDIDNGLFELPKDIDFTDMADFLKEMNKYGNTP
jgi:hypothetical protein